MKTQPEVKIMLSVRIAQSLKDKLSLLAWSNRQDLSSMIVDVLEDFAERNAAIIEQAEKYQVPTLSFNMPQFSFKDDTTKDDTTKEPEPEVMPKQKRTRRKRNQTTGEESGVKGRKKQSAQEPAKNITAENTAADEGSDKH